MERTFAREVEMLRKGNGEHFEGEGILAITKALLQAGVSYVGGYQGAPVSHLNEMRNRRTLVAADIGNACLQKRFGDGENTLAFEMFAVALA